jgi:PAS domain-containing protein
MAVVLATAGTRRLRGVGGLLSGLVIGAFLGAGIGYAAVTVFGAPITVIGAVSLGLAFGGGLGVVTNYLVTGDGESVDETMTVEREPAQAEPTPADLFEEHPDPVLYVADEGHGPVVRAANAAYGTAFDIPADAVLGAPLEEAVLAVDDTERVVTAVDTGEQLDAIVTCETGDGERTFRIRTAGVGDDGYLMYTPVEH